MNIKSIATAAAAAGLLACATPSFATPVTLTFEGHTQLRIRQRFLQRRNRHSGWLVRNAGLGSEL